MFLHSGASLHGHEYSSPGRRLPASPQHANRRSPLLRSALANQMAPSDVRAHSTAPPALRFRRPMPDYTYRAAPAQVGDLKTMPEEERESTDEEGDGSSSPMSADHRSLSGSDSSEPSQTTTTTTTASSSITTHRHKRPARETAKLVLAYPAPRFARRSLVVQKVVPQLLLQLQQVSAANRPVPTMDAFPFLRVACPTVGRRIAKRFPYRKSELSSTDVLLVTSEDYDTAPSAASDAQSPSESLDQRKLIALFSPIKKSDQAEILLDDGSVWLARPLPTGSFDFVHVDANGGTTTVRWARRAGPRPSSLMSDESHAQPSQGSTEPRYTFSLINPHTRRHPILATLTQSSLDIQSHFAAVPAGPSRHPSTRRRSQTLPTAVPKDRPLSRPGTFPTSPSARSAASSPDHEADSELVPPGPDSRTFHPVSDTLKHLISVTAVWLALRSGWSPHYRPPATTTSHVPASDTSVPATYRPPRLSSWSRRNSIDETAAAARSRDPSPVPFPAADNPAPRRAISMGASCAPRRSRLQGAGGSLRNPPGYRDHPRPVSMQHIAPAPPPPPAATRRVQSAYFAGGPVAGAEPHHAASPADGKSGRFSLVVRGVKPPADPESPMTDVSQRGRGEEDDRRGKAGGRLTRWLRRLSVR